MKFQESCERCIHYNVCGLINTIKNQISNSDMLRTPKAQVYTAIRTNIAQVCLHFNEGEK